MAKVEDRHAVAAREMACRAGLGRAFDRTTRLEVLALAGSYRVACRVERPDGQGGSVAQTIAILSDRVGVESLVALILAEADAQVGEVRVMAGRGELPATVASFADLHDHFDANMLGAGGDLGTFEPHPLVGVQAADLSEAWCGVLNCAHNAVDAMIKGGGLQGLAPAAPAR